MDPFQVVAVTPGTIYTLRGVGQVNVEVFGRFYYSFLELLRVELALLKVREG